MPFIGQPARKYTAYASIAAIGLLLSSCSESRISQCRKLINVANQVVTDVQTVAENASTSPSGNTGASTEVINRVADAANSARVNMEELSLNDTQLQDFQNRYATMYAEIYDSTSAMLDASEARDREAGRQAYTAFQAATSQEATLVSEINQYCAD
ncbi:hypothetical protein [Egbenema bharatensis]|uniref:hypothetical protein n=1 Tax=Egbenema bharatensis TaxID=3463334 RepID=UPI003A85184B